MGAELVAAFRVGLALLGVNAAPTSTVAPVPPALIVSEVKGGAGAVAKAGDRLTIEFSFKTLDGIEVASTSKRGLPYTLVLGHGEGSLWNQALEGTRAGSERSLMFGADGMFGSGGLGAVIPKGAQLMGTIRVVRIVRGGPPQPGNPDSRR